MRVLEFEREGKGFVSVVLNNGKSEQLFKLNISKGSSGLIVQQDLERMKEFFTGGNSALVKGEGLVWYEKAVSILEQYLAG